MKTNDPTPEQIAKLAAIERKRREEMNKRRGCGALTVRVPRVYKTPRVR